MLGSCACRMASSRGLSGSLPPRWSKGGSSSSKCSAPLCPRQAPQVGGGQGVARTLLSWALCLQCIILTCVLLLQAVLVTVL